MKASLLKCTLLLLFCFFSRAAYSQEEEATGLPGDNFSLEGALEMFKKANSPEEFEKLMNVENNKVNNLDLDEDGQTDYIHVNELVEGDNHVFVLSVAVSEKENQDIAVIELEKNGNEKAIVQIIGEEEIFGEQIIMEPSDENDKFADVEENDPNFVVNVWALPLVSYVYRPLYNPWVSPWRWRVYPTWWRPWRPLAWRAWHPYRIGYRTPAFRVVHTHRVVHAHRVYAPVRATSVTVKTRHTEAHKNYQVKRSKTTVTGARGNSVTRKSKTVTGPRGNSKTKTKTTVRGREGKVKGQKTTVKKNRRN